MHGKERKEHLCIRRFKAVNRMLIFSLVENFTVNVARPTAAQKHFLYFAGTWQYVQSISDFR